ncbi:Helix-turn-helix domain-containing protein [Caloramator quimbayensis]|uniref:Helix-turn-helix domain-containing protein n=1 Tax=Caloramator quimbayensis TaxID=1147123 RepID=A0A1T4Y433_9CLOT|nr:HEAT repeat domain-containing protein [Caloramator quimbayensis]SKA96393.1 Helix-turn-helix domain-containing protein [Caloramator quimbayensis]
MNNLSWNNIKNLNEEEITYMLYLEGKSIDIISRIRNMEKNTIEKQIIECKIKYRVFENSNSEKDIINKLKRCHKNERQSIINLLSNKDKENLENYLLDNLFNAAKEDCGFYIWLLGELKSKRALQPIYAFLKCNDGNIKRICCSAIGKIGDISSENLLISCLSDSRPQVVQYAIKALSKIKSQKSVFYLNKIAEDENQREYVKNAAVSAIEEITKGDNFE